MWGLVGNSKLLVFSCEGSFTLEIQSEDVNMEHLPEKVIEDLSDISRWLVANGNSTEFLKDYITQRSSMLIKSLNG